MINLLCVKLGIGEIVLIIACAALVVGVAVAAIARRVKGRTSCDCAECSGCCERCKADVKQKTDINK